MSEANTQDLSKLGYREIGQLGELLTAYADNAVILGDGVKWEYNANSDNLFLVDEDCRVAMLTEDGIEEFYTCSNCGHEGFSDSFTRRTEKKDGDIRDTTFLACPKCEKAGVNPEDYLIELVNPF